MGEASSHISITIVAFVLTSRDVFRGSSKFLPSLVPAFGWGGMFAVADSAIKRVDPFHLTAIRYIVATSPLLTLLASAALARRAPSKTTLGFVVLALAGLLLVIGHGDPLTVFD